MNMFLWILQILLALHTITGAMWKFSHNAAQTMASLGAIPDGFWLTLGVLELLCAAGLVIPLVSKSLRKLPPFAALFIVAEMILLCVVHLSSGAQSYSPMGYWLVVAVISGFIAYGRLKIKPI